MFGLGPATRIYIAVEAIDMRKGFDSLAHLVLAAAQPQTRHAEPPAATPPPRVA